MHFIQAIASESIECVSYKYVAVPTTTIIIHSTEKYTPSNENAQMSEHLFERVGGSEKAFRAMCYSYRLDILGHGGHYLGMDGTQFGVLKQTR